MELVNEIVNNQFALYIPVALVLVGAILVFTFGFKSAEQPPFDKLSSIDSEDRKTLGKKKKLKEKKTANGSVPNVTEKVDKSPSKETKKKEQDNAKKTDNKPKSTVEKRKNDSVKLVEEKNKKNAKAKITEKPADFDDGSWETVPTKGDKKKKQDSPAKKEKKPKKLDKPSEIDKLAKEIANRELQENDKVTKTSDVVAKEPEPQEIEPVEIKIETVEIKKEKKVEKKKKADPEIVEIVEKEKAVITPPPAPAKSEPAPVVKPQEDTVKQPAANVAFDELGDVWTEAKQPKKSKKKSRREN